MKAARAAALAGAIVALGATASTQNDAPPDRDVLFEHVRDNLTRAERVVHLYAFRERRTDVHTNLFGKLGTDGTSSFEVYPSPIRRLTYRRLMARNDLPLSARELAEQDRRYRARLADFKQQDLAPDAEERRRLSDDPAERRSRRVNDIVAVLRFHVERRAVYKGVPAVVVSFTPRRDATPTTRHGRTAQKFAGTIWIDEAAYEVMHVEATSIDDLSFGYGMVARLGRGVTASFTRRPVEGGVWMPTEVTLKGRGRAAVVRKLLINYTVEWFDYRRLSGTSMAPFVDTRVYGEPHGRPE